jgi:hypothetical protein
LPRITAIVRIRIVSANVLARRCRVGHCASVADCRGGSRPADRIDVDELRAGVPAVLHWDFDHFVVLKSVSAVMPRFTTGSRGTPVAPRMKSRGI